MNRFAVLILSLVASLAHAECWPVDEPSKVLIAPITGQRWSHYAAWSCVEPTKVYTRVIAFNRSEFISALASVRTKSQADAYYAANPTSSASESDKAYLLAIANQHAPVAVIAGAVTRPTYALNADGTRQATATGKRIAQGKQCDPLKRVKDTVYYSVQGQLATDGSTLGNVVAVCSISSAVGLNK